MYVDDCITSVKDVNTAVTVASQLCNLFRKTGFRLRRGISNSRDVLEKLPKSEILDKMISLKCGPLPVERTLGVCWDTEQDSLKFQSQLNSRPDTRRGVLARVATVFHPLGQLSLFTERKNNTSGRLQERKGLG